ncbi:MAG: hypothetical protein ACFCU4_10075 [Puniceicoccaceae bacterium]
MKTPNSLFAKLAILAVLLGHYSFPTLSACSRVLWNDNERAVIVGRNMDWFEDIRSNM